MAISSYIRRYLCIIRKLKENDYVSIEELVNHVKKEVYYFENNNIGVSERTLKRDISGIKNDLDISIIHVKKHGYHISKDKETQRNLEYALEPLSLLEPLYANNELSGFVFMEKRQSKGQEHLSFLINAVSNSDVIKFCYKKYDNTLSKERIVEPYALKEFKGRWYLLAMEVDGIIEEKGMIKTWGVDRIEELKITGKSFQRDSKISIEEEFKHSFGIYSDKDKGVEEVVLSFSSIGGRYNESLPLHKSQTTLIDDGKEFRIRLEVKITYDFIMELLSQSEDMKVIAPNHLKETLIEIHKNALKSLQ